MDFSDRVTNFNDSKGESSVSDVNDKVKKKPRKKSVDSKKKKPSPVLKVDEETIANGTISDNARDLPEDLDNEDMNSSTCNNNSLSGEDEILFTHYILRKILNQKKLELLESDEVVEFLRSKSSN